MLTIDHGNITYRKCIKRGREGGGRETGRRSSQKSVQDVRVGVVMLLFGADYMTAAIGVVGIRVVVGDFPVVSGSSGGGSDSGGAGDGCNGGGSSCGRGDCGGDGGSFRGVGGRHIGGCGCDVKRGSHGGTDHGGGIVGRFGEQG